MSSNLIFHVVSKRKWKEFNKRGVYKPDGNRFEEGIPCINADDLNEYINLHFEGRRQVVVLVIDKSRLMNKLITNEGSSVFYVSKEINQAAILDKIFIRSNKAGRFDVEVSEN